MIEPFSPTQIEIDFLKQLLWSFPEWGEFSPVDFFFKSHADGLWKLYWIEADRDNDWENLRKLES